MNTKKVTMSDVAAHAGLSQSAVSMILSAKNSSRFTQETIDKVYDACRELGYKHPSISQDNSKYILIMSENPTIPYYSELAQQINHLANLNGYRTIICSTNRNKELEASYLQLALKPHIAGIIYLTYPNHPQMVNEIAKEVPIVAICDEADNLSIDIIEIDNLQVSFLLIDHLVELGHKKIMLFTASPETNLGRRTRIKGLKKRMARYGLEDSLYIRIRDVDQQSESSGETNDYTIGYEFMQDPSVFEAGATAFIGMTDVMARGIADALLTKGYQIPQDFSVCGYDNSIYSKLLPLSLTTVELHFEQKAQSAFELLQHNMDVLSRKPNTLFQNARIKIEHPPVLLIQKSTGPAKQA